MPYMKLVRNVLLFLTCILLLPGCKLLPFMTPPKKVVTHAEFEDLPGNSIAVVVNVPNTVSFDYENIGRKIGTRVTIELKNKIKNVTLVNPSTVIRYLNANPSWDSMGFRKMGKDLGVEYILCITIHEYSGMAKGMVSAVQARIIADADLHAVFCDVSDTRVWNSKDPLTVIHPPNNKLYETSNEDAILNQAEILFAETLVKKFYKSKSTDDWFERL